MSGKPKTWKQIQAAEKKIKAADRKHSDETKKAIADAAREKQRMQK